MAEVRNEIYGERAVDSLNSVLISYAGGYGTDGAYNDSLISLCHTASNMTKKDESYLFAFLPHPGYPASYEEQIFIQFGCLQHIHIIGASMDLSTAGECMIFGWLYLYAVTIVVRLVFRGPFLYAIDMHFNIWWLIRKEL